MDCISLLPNIRCSSCGSVIGDKFIHFNTLVECGSTRLEAFALLDIHRYCCRKELTNPIVFLNKKDNDRVFPEEEVNISGEQYSINTIDSKVSKLTDNLSKEVAIVPLSHSTGDKFLEDLRLDLLNLSPDPSSDIPFRVKEIDPDEVINILLPVNRSKEEAGSGFIVDRINKAYRAC